VLAFVWLVGFIAGGVLLTGLLGPLWAWAASLILVSLAGIVLFSIAKKMSPAAAMAELLLRIAQVRGFWTGARNKPKVDLRRLAETRGLYFILAGVPIDDTGGGARSTQLALELLRQNYWVVYLHRYPRWESQAAVIKIAHPNLFTYGLGEFKWDDFSHRYQEPLKGRDIVALVEFPSPEFLPFMRTLQQAGGKILYDMIDDWNSSLGNWGFSPSIEREMIRLGDGLMATAPILQEKLEEASQRTVLLHPNAVNSRLFNPGRRYPRPDDLPDAAWSAIYIGALWGDWFDWDLLEAVARAYPQASLVVVGDYRGQCPNPPANLTFLGLKPQSALPAYLAHTDIAIIPWKVNEITQATSPLKLYEYLAMRKPVVTPDLLPLHGIPGVFRAADKQDFVRLVNDVRLQELPMQEIDAFVSENNWQARIRQLIEWLKQEHQQG
jgi:glycosyltransferase involved in cell wall biosynthesis